jgi:WD40 repeat protein
VPSPDGRYFLICGLGGAAIYDVDMEAHVGTLLKHFNWVQDAAFSPDGTKVVTVSTDRTAGVWSVPSGEPLSSPLLHPAEVNTVAFSPDGSSFATGQAGGLICLWKLPEGLARDYRILKEDGETFLVLSPDGKYFLPVGTARALFSTLLSTRVFDAATGEPAGEELKCGSIILSGTFSPDGRSVVTLQSSTTVKSERHWSHYRPQEHPGWLQFWNWRTGKKILEPMGVPSEPIGAAFDRDGRRIMVLGANGDLLTVDAGTGNVLQRRVHEGTIHQGGWFVRRCVQLSPDGRSFVTSGVGTTVRVWEAESGEPRYPPLAHKGCLLDTQFSPDGRWLVTASTDHTVTVWDSATGERLASLVHPDAVYEACFSPDGRRVLTAGRDHMARLWDWRSGGLAAPEMSHDSEVFSATFTPDGRAILTTGQMGRLSVWDSLGGKPLASSRSLGSPAQQILVTPDGKTAIVPALFPPFYGFCLDDWIAPYPRDLEPPDLRTLAEILCAQRVLENGGLASLTSREWNECWKDFRQRHPGFHAMNSSPDEKVAWHGENAARYESDRDWDAARWHLERMVELGAKVSRIRFRRLEEFVRSWRFSGWTEPWIDHSVFLAMDAEKLKRIEESARGAKLLRSKGPFIDFAYFVSRAPKEKPVNLAGYALRTIIADRSRTVKVFAGSDDAIRIWLSGKPEPILEHLIKRAAEPDQETAVAELRPGENVMVVEISQGGNLWGLFLRLEDESGRKLRLADDGRLEPLEDW